jgi:hypothetical protein
MEIVRQVRLEGLGYVFHLHLVCIHDELEFKLSDVYDLLYLPLLS